ncbi:MAG: hypothetical protein IKC69_07950 [Clostridia bacterium]|nr:hypothetical protein [Clostridia bacterium]
MTGTVLDPNMTVNETADEGTVDWYEVPSEHFALYGVRPDADGVLTRRLPLEIAEEVSQGVLRMSGYGAGGRVVFATSSSFVAVKAEYGKGAVPTVCNHCFSYGFDLYRYSEEEGDVFVGACRPAAGFDYHLGEFKMKTHSKGKMTCYTLNLPHFSELKRLYIGLEKGSCFGERKQYRNALPVVYYGSSITHGAAAGRPGNTYESFISQRYNLDYINLGFSGNAKGELKMAEYLAGLAMCLFVSDYDYNAPSVEHLRETHYRLYETVRKKHPSIPYVMITRPNFFRSPSDSIARREVVLESYRRAVDSGDRNVWFIDGESLFEGEHYESCTSDGTHPNDLGFYRMAAKIGPVIAQALGLD